MYTAFSHQINTIRASVSLQRIHFYQLWGGCPKQKGGLRAWSRSHSSQAGAGFITLPQSLLFLTTDKKHWLRVATFITTFSEMRLQGAQVGPILPSVSGEGNLLPPAGAGGFCLLPFCALYAEGNTQVHVWYRYLPEAYKVSHMASPRIAHELGFSLHGTEAIK